MHITLSYNQMIAWHEAARRLSGRMKDKNCPELEAIYDKAANGLSLMFDAADESKCVVTAATFNFPVFVINNIEKELLDRPIMVKVTLTHDNIREWSAMAKSLSDDESICESDRIEYDQIARSMKGILERISAIPSKIDCVEFEFRLEIARGIQMQLRSMVKQKFLAI